MEAVVVPIKIISDKHCTLQCLDLRQNTPSLIPARDVLNSEASFRRFAGSLFACIVGNNGAREMTLQVFEIRFPW